MVCFYKLLFKLQPGLFRETDTVRLQYHGEAEIAWYLLESDYLINLPKLCAYCYLNN